MFRRCVGRSRLDCIGPHGINVPRVWPALGSLPLGREEQSPAPSSNYSGLLRFLRQRTRAYAPARARNGSPAPAIGPGTPFAQPRPEEDPRLRTNRFSVVDMSLDICGELPRAEQPRVQRGLFAG